VKYAADEIELHPKPASLCLQAQWQFYVQSRLVLLTVQLRIAVAHDMADQL
jgi:hypothetical protein